MLVSKILWVSKLVNTKSVIIYDGKLILFWKFMFSPQYLYETTSNNITGICPEWMECWYQQSKRKNHFINEYSTLGLLNEIQPLGPALLPKSPIQRCTRKLCFKYSFLNAEPKLKTSSRKFIPSCEYHTSLNIKRTSNTNRNGGDKYTFLLIFELDKLLVGREKRGNYPWWILLEGNFLRWKLSGR